MAHAFDQNVMEVVLPVDMSWIWGVIKRAGWTVAGEKWRVELACYERIKVIVTKNIPNTKISPSLIEKSIQLACRQSIVANEGAQRPEVFESEKRRRADLRVDGIAYLLSKLTL